MIGSVPDVSERINVLGVGISAINMDQALDQFDRWIARKEQSYVCVTAVHGVMECQSDPALREVYNRSGMTTPDGMPLVWLGRIQGRRNMGRVYGPDLLLALCDHSIARGYRHFLLGRSPTPGVADALHEKLASRFPGLQVVGTAHAPPDRDLTADEDAEIVDQINEARPDVIWVGLGTPTQDHWMADHVGKISASVMIGVGAAFDFHSGRKRQAPLWMQRSGLEWLFRLIQEPARLWRRYLINNPLFVALVLLQFARVRSYPPPSVQFPEPIAVPTYLRTWR